MLVFSWICIVRVSYEIIIIGEVKFFVCNLITLGCVMAWIFYIILGRFWTFSSVIIFIIIFISFATFLTLLICDITHAFIIRSFHESTSILIIFIIAFVVDDALLIRLFI